MSRSLERNLGPAGTNVFTTRLTVPASHKYEIVASSWSEATGQAGTVYFLVLPAGGGALFVDEHPYAAGHFVQRFAEYSLVLYAGDKIQAGAVAAAGTSWSVWLDYVDVDYTT